MSLYNTERWTRDDDRIEGRESGRGKKIGLKEGEVKGGEERSEG
jgi:hypothetical protein